VAIYEKGTMNPKDFWKEIAERSPVEREVSEPLVKGKGGKPMKHRQTKQLKAEIKSLKAKMR